MALWVTPTDDHDVYTILYLLKDALRSALADAAYFESASCPKPNVKGADHAEITARLGRFRDACTSLREREALMLTKILRVRQWAEELRPLAPDVADDIDQFLEATSACFRCQGDFVMNAQRIFNGGVSLARFLDQRGASDTRGTHRGQSTYLVGGEMEAFELRVACEVFMAQIDEVYFAPEVPADAMPLQSFLTYLDAAADEIRQG